MQREQLELLVDISKIEQQQRVLLEKVKTPQQELLQSYGQRFLISKKMLHKNIEVALGYLEGSFAQTALEEAYIAFVLDNQLDVSPDNFNILKMLVGWTDYFPTLRAKPTLELTEAVFQGGEVSAFASLEQLLCYINFITPDLLKLLRKRSNVENSNSNINEADKYNLDKVGVDELLSFLNVALPKVAFNILLPNEMLPPELKKDHQTFECLYKNRSLEFFMRSKPGYGNLMRVLLRGVIGMSLKPTQLRLLMEISFRYFYAFHYDKKQTATDLFVQAYNKLDESTRFSLADEFILFFRIIRKLGKGKFADFLADKSPWVRDITSKVTEKSLVGYQKETVKPFNPLEITDVFVVDSGCKARRCFEVFDDYSLFYFKVDVVALDITIRLYYAGEVDSDKTSERLLIEQVKKSGQFTSSIMAARRGLYIFQFDNSYSWINSKTIRYENVVLSPLEIKSVEPSKWILPYFNNVPSNEAAPERVVLIQKIVERKQEREKEELSGTGNITKNGPFYNLKIVRDNHVYEFETESEDVLVKRFGELAESSKDVQWRVSGEPLELDEDTDLRKILSGEKIKPKQSSEKAEEPKKEANIISLQEYRDDEEEESKS